MSRKSRIIIVVTIIVLVIAIAVGVAAWYFLIYRRNPEPSTPTPEDPPANTAALSLHFLELGNAYAGDCIYIKSGDVDILIDAGSREDSAPTITKYIDTYCTDGTLEYVIVTHGHQDHIAALAGNSSYESIFKHYECEVIIDFPKTNSNSQVLKRYYASRDEEVKAGATHYTALQCYNEEDGAKRSYSIGEGISFEILYNYYYDHNASNENNYSVCILLRQGQQNFLLTGDLEGEGEVKLAENNELPQCVLYKAGHHGSKTSSSDELLSVIKPQIVCVCCVAGSTEYTKNKNNTFPTQDAINRIAKYTTKIYVTSEVDDSSSEGYRSLNGNIVVSSAGGAPTVKGSNHSIPLPETDWFAANRTLPN